MIKKRVFFNEDSNHFVGGEITENGFLKNCEITEKSLVDYIDMYEDSDITDFVMCINCEISSTQSEVWESYIDKYEKTEENGEPIDYKDTMAKAYYDLYQKGIDMYSVWIDRLNKININPWISFRMNDCHCMYEAHHIVKGEIVDARPDLWIAENRPALGYFDKAQNYLKEEVRQRMLSYIEEQLLKYDIYGIELDFHREPYCYPSGAKEKGRAVIIDFLERVKEIVNRISKERGKEIKINMLCQANPVNAYDNGYDMGEIAKRGLVDMVVACPRFDTTNNDIPVKIWKQILGENVEFACKQEWQVRPYFDKTPYFITMDTALGQTAAFENLGTDFTYVFNYMKAYLKFDNFKYCQNTIFNDENYTRLFKMIGHTEDIPYQNLRYPLTYDDFVNLYDRNKMYMRLPETVKPGQNSPFKIVTGKILREQKKYVIFETASSVNPEDITVYANDAKASFLKDGKEEKGLFRENVYTFEFDAEVYDCVEVDIMSKKECVIEYIEIFAEGLK